MAPLAKLENSIVRVFNQSDSIVGVGFLASDNSIVTCAHIISRVGEIYPKASPKPNNKIVVDFPLVAPRKKLQTQVIFSSLTEEMDFAELQLENVLPSGVQPISIIANTDTILGHRIKAYGFPKGYDEGVWVSASVLGKNAMGWLQVEGFREAGYRIQSGFSGGPVWDEQMRGAIGIVVAADTDERTKAAFVLPFAAIIKMYPDIEKKIKLTIYTELVSDAMEFLENRNFKKVLTLCDEHMKGNLYNPELHLLTAIALAQGRRVDLLNRDRIRLVEYHLIKAINNTITESTALVMLGGIKFDYYVTNGLQEENPTFRQISERLRFLDSKFIDLRFLKYLKISEDAFRRMGVKHQSR